MMPADGNDRAKVKGLLWLVATVAVALMLALGLETLVGLVPWSVEKTLAKLTPSPVKGTFCKATLHPAALKNLVAIESRLRIPSDQEAGFKVEFTVIADAQVNAFATLGGHIYIYEGLIKQAQSAEELAGVLAHEIEHVKRRHILQGVFTALLASAFMDTEVLRTLMNLHFSRKQEAQADEGAVKRLVLARIDTRGFQQFFERMAEKNESAVLLSDHPSDTSRAEAIAKYPVKEPLPLLSPADWKTLQKICD